MQAFYWKYNYWWITQAIVFMWVSLPSTASSFFLKNWSRLNWRNSGRKGGILSRSWNSSRIGLNSGGIRSSINSNGIFDRRRGVGLWVRLKIIRSCRTCWGKSLIRRNSFRPGRNRDRWRNLGILRGRENSWSIRLWRIENTMIARKWEDSKR